MYFKREQIAWLVSAVGQPRASVLFHNIFDSYRHYLHSTDMRELYDSDYFQHIDNHPLVENYNGVVRINIYTQYAFNYLKKSLLHGERVLDYGCGTGDFALALAHETGATVVGIDDSKEAIQEANHRAAEAQAKCEFLENDFALLEKPNRYKYVVLNDVVEHLSDSELVQVFARFKKVLGPQGELLIHTPNGAALCNDTDNHPISWLFKSYHKFRYGWQGHERTVEQLYYDQVHINIKSFRQLSSLLTRCGYSSRVFYDEPHRFRLFNILSSNMLVIANPLG